MALAGALALVFVGCGNKSTAKTDGGGGSGKDGATAKVDGGGTGSPAVCDQLKSKCSAQDAPTADEVADCKNTMATRCGSFVQAAIECLRKNEKCGADNKIDPMSVGMACSQQLAARGTCVPGGTDGGGMPGMDGGMMDDMGMDDSGMGAE
ncbi:MAG: hypothetical protein IT371_23370 [Deltaproteobacteria bacterium]|nr:hypothetical protein [Deltaproteobacteria bacterium]